MRARFRGVASLAGVLALAAGILATPVAAKVKTKVDYDKAHRFDGIKTWKWLEDPRVINASVNPDIVQDNRFSAEALAPPVKVAVEREMAAKGYRLVGAGDTADATVAVYMIGRAGTSDQTLGQFISYNVGWPLLVTGYTPTQSLRIFETGTIIIDVIDPAEKMAVWRATTTSEIDRANSQEKRLSLLDKVVRDSLKKFPPK
jgi:hypothetical protein